MGTQHSPVSKVSKAIYVISLINPGDLRGFTGSLTSAGD
jgi:hypothetical protein